MHILSPDFTQQRLRIDYAALQRAGPKGVYVTPLSDHALQWAGVLFVRRGPYANAILRFRITFPIEYPERPPVITFLTDIFHPLVTPLTTYTYSTRDTGASETVSAQDDHRLPPGGLSLRHGFPEWFQAPSPASELPTASMMQTPHIVEVLQYLRVVFDTETVLDSVPLEVSANSGAWHAWRSYRTKGLGTRLSGSRDLGSPGASSPTSDSDRSTSPRQQPGGARRPGEWNWYGVWEERVRKSIASSTAESVLFGGDGSSDMIGFLKMDPETAQQALPEYLWSNARQPGEQPPREAATGVTAIPD